MLYPDLHILTNDEHWTVTLETHKYAAAAGSLLFCDRDEGMPTGAATMENPTVPPPAPPYNPEEHVPEMRGQGVHATALRMRAFWSDIGRTPGCPDQIHDRWTQVEVRWIPSRRGQKQPLRQTTRTRLTRWTRTTSEEDQRHLMNWNQSTVKMCRGRHEWPETFFTSVVRTM